MRKPLSSDQKCFLRPYFPLIGGIFVLKSGLRFLFRALEVPIRKVRKSHFLAKLPILSFWILNVHIIICQFQKRSTVKHFLSLTACSCHLWLCFCTLYYTVCCLFSMFSFKPNKLRLILKFMSRLIIQHFFVPACLVGRKKLFSRKP